MTYSIAMNQRSLLAISLVLALGGLGCGPASVAAPGGNVAAPAGAGLELLRTPRVVGQRWSKTDHMTSSMVLDAGGKQIKIDGTQHKVEEFEVVEVDAAGIVTKVKVSFPERENTEVIDGKTKTKPTALVGKSYVAWIEGGAMKATLTDGSPASAAELTELTDALDELGKPEEMELIMTGRTWKVDEPYVFTADDLARLAKTKTPGKAGTKSMKLILEGVAGDAATFSLDSELATEGMAELTIKMQGSVLVAVKTGRPTSLSLTGTVEGTTGGMPVTGTMSGNVSYKYAGE